MGTDLRQDRRALIADGAVALSLAAVSVALATAVVEGAGRLAVAVGISLAHVLPLAARRRRPVVVAGAMAATALASVAAGVPMVVLGPASAVAAYTVGSRIPDPNGHRVLVGVLATMALVVAGNGGDAGTVASNAAVLATAWWLGRRSLLATQEMASERAAASTAAERAVAAERLRIARELHDVVAHAMSVIAVQAGTGRFVIDRSPDVAAAALATIEDVSRDALDELRRLLAVLRDDTEGGAEGLGPAPGVDDLATLTAATSAAGVATDLRVVGPPADLSAGLALCVYRIVQEALTNVRKHARAASATVVVTYEPAAVVVEVTDDGIGAAAPTGAGHGIVGMRERAELYGGSLSVDDVGGLRVRATLPLELGR